MENLSLALFSLILAPLLFEIYRRAAAFRQRHLQFKSSMAVYSEWHKAAVPAYTEELTTALREGNKAKADIIRRRYARQQEAALEAASASLRRNS